MRLKMWITLLFPWLQPVEGLRIGCVFHIFLQNHSETGLRSIVNNLKITLSQFRGCKQVIPMWIT